MGFWAVTRFDGLRQVYLEVRDDSYGLEAGDSHLWTDSFCINMVAGRTPRIAPDAMAVPEYREAGVAEALEIGAYIGVPIYAPDGGVFGTICGLDPRRQGPELAEHRLLLDLLGGLLTTILDADLRRTALARELETALASAEIDQLTGLLNRRGWERYVTIEDARLRRFGDTGAVVMLDLDGLKRMNDANGHAAGDAHLQVAATAIASAARASDVVARLGGDEFALICRDLGESECAALVVRIADSLAKVRVSASIGHAPYTIGGGLLGAIQAADASMYAKKQMVKERRSTR